MAIDLAQQQQTHPKPLLEVCVDTIEGAQAAICAGAGRLELCAALSEGGLTPSVGLMQAAASLSVPCYAMIRPRAGLFQFTRDEERIMLADINAAKNAGLDGVVLGAQENDGQLDVAMLERLSLAAGSLGRTLHRVIDVVPDQLQAVDIAIDLGFERVLTSGGSATAVEGLPVIREMYRRAAGRISVMPGSGVNADNIAQLLAVGVSEVHASCADKVLMSDNWFTFTPAGGATRTSESKVRTLVSLIKTD